MSCEPRILVAGIGNIFLGDDAFGVAVAQRLLGQPWASNIRVADFGIRGIDLLYSLLDGYDAVIFIDAVPRGNGPPGTLYLLEPLLGEPGAEPPLLEAHSLDPLKVLQTAVSMGASVQHIYIVACEPALPAEGDDFSPEMSAAVSAAVEPAILMVNSLVQRLHNQLQLQPQT